MSLISSFGIISFDVRSVTWIFLPILIALYLVYLHRLHADAPPGPWGLPLFGYLLFFSKKPFEDFIRLGKKYGNVFSVKIGSRNVVVLNDYDVIQATFTKQGEIYSGKPRDGMAAEVGEYKNIFVTDGNVSRVHRSFVLSSLRDFGFGKKRMEEHIQEEADLILYEFVKKRNEPIDIKVPISSGVANIIGFLVFGQKFNYDDKQIMKNLCSISEIASDLSHFTLIDAFPALRYFIPFSLLGFDTFGRMKKQVYDFTDMKIKEHKETFDANNIRDLLDAYLLKMEENVKTEQLNTHNVFTDDYIRANAILLFATGTDTTRSSLIWAFKILAVNPDVQTQIQNEIDEIIGRDRLPSMSDKTKMPFTEATLLEIERFVSLLPLTFYHRITKDTVLKGYKIPKNTFVLANLWNVHHNTDIWKDPHMFKPRRFLDNDGKISHLRDFLIPFSIGKRNCLGESLAKMEIFIFVTRLLQKVTFLPATDTSFDTSHEVPLRKLKSCVLSIKIRE